MEAIKALAFKISDNLIGLALLIGAPILNMVQNIDPGGVFRFNSCVLVFSEDGLVHCGEIDDRDS